MIVIIIIPIKITITVIIMTTWAEPTDASGACDASQLCPDRLVLSIMNVVACHVTNCIHYLAEWPMY